MNAPIALTDNTAAKTDSAANEYSGIVTELLVGTKNACIAMVLAGMVSWSVLMV